MATPDSETRRRGAPRGRDTAPRILSAASPAGAPPDPWRVAAALMAAPALEAQLSLLVEEAPRVGRGDSAAIYLHDERLDAPRAIVHAGHSPDAFGQPRPRGITHHVLSTGLPVVVTDALADARVNPVVHTAGIRSIVALPLITRRVAPILGPGDEADRGDAPLAAPDRLAESQRQPIGVLYVNAHRPNAFDAQSVDALKGLAALAAVAIDNTFLLEMHRATEQRMADALRLREQFVSVASHELRAPLTPVKGYAQAIARRLDRTVGQPIDELWLRKALRIMVGQIDRMDRLVTDLLDASRVRAGRFEIDAQPLDLITLAHEALTRFQEMHEAGSAGIVEEPGGVTAGAPAVELDQVKHTFVWCPGASCLPGTWDGGRLDQLITNLLSNAVKYSPEGGVVELIVEPAAPEDDTFRRRVPHIAPGWVHLAVRDEGIGLPNDSVADPSGGIFQPFTRGENAVALPAAGFGLGLFICAEAVRRHGGVIWAESRGEGQGAAFHVLLPPEPADP